MCVSVYVDCIAAEHLSVCWALQLLVLRQHFVSDGYCNLYYHSSDKLPVTRVRPVKGDTRNVNIIILTDNFFFVFCKHGHTSCSQ